MEESRKKTKNYTYISALLNHVDLNNTEMFPSITYALFNNIFQSIF